MNELSVGKIEQLTNANSLHVELPVKNKDEQFPMGTADWVSRLEAKIETLEKEIAELKRQVSERQTVSMEVIAGEIIDRLQKASAKQRIKDFG